MKKTDYIAVFDSGLGGLSVLRELQKLMPEERFLYFGDRKNAPYGVKTTQQVRDLTLAAAEKLMAKGCKALVVACNTATAVAVETLRSRYRETIIVGIEPAVKPAAERFPGGTVGILGTTATLHSQRFQQLLARRGAGCRFLRLSAPGLVPLVEQGRFCAAVQELSLRNVRLTAVDTMTGKTVFSDFGEMLFTHYGLSGPLVLSASAHLAAMSEGRYELRIDLKPALDEKTLDARLLADFTKYQNKDFLNALSDLLPQKLIAPLVALSGIDARKKVNAITREERARLLALLKALPISIRCFRPIDEAIITKGGVALGEITPSTMGAKRVKGLYFAGEVLDLDAYTGGFNLQIAFSTAVLAGESAACALNS